MVDWIVVSIKTQDMEEKKTDVTMRCFRKSCIHLGRKLEGDLNSCNSENWLLVNRVTKERKKEDG